MNAVRLPRTASQYQNTTLPEESPSPTTTTTATADLGVDTTDVPTQSVSTSVSTSIDSITTTSAPQCIDTTVTYTNEVPSTVYITVDGSYDVTVTASNASVTAQPVLETPPSACSTTIIYDGSMTAETSPGDTPATTRHVGPDVASSTSEVNGPERSSAASFSLPTQQLVSTVVVTKKTPVPVVQIPTTTEPAITFQLKTDKTSPAAPSVQGASTTSVDDTPGVVASIIASVINSPFAVPALNSAVTTPSFVAVPATSTLNGVGVTIEPTNVVIGTQTLRLPLNSQTTVTYSGQTFTVQPNEIVASGTTYQIANQLATITQAPSLVTVAGVTVEVDSTKAVISGTTYRIGSGAGSTTVVVNGQTISVGSNGVGFPGQGHTTLAPPMTVAGGFKIVVVSGLTISVDETEAVISGTHLKIGAGATTTSVVIAGETVTAGPGGLSLASTTIEPASVPTGIVQSTSPALAGTSNSAMQFASLSSKLLCASETIYWVTAMLLSICLLI